MEEDKKLSPGPELSGPEDEKQNANAPPVNSGTPPDESLPPEGEGPERSEADEGETQTPDAGADPRIGPNAEEAAGEDPPALQDSAAEAPEEGSPAPDETAKPPAKKKKKGGMALALRDFVNLLIKLVFILLVVVVTFTFLFGAFRNADPGMLPAIKDGDLVFYYRLDKFYHNGDVLVARYNDKMICLRVIAVEGDVVDITENGLYINGSLQMESNIYENTYRFEEGVDFPVTVREGEVFVLGDARRSAADSRVFGPIQIDDTLGKVMAVFRRRNI